MTFKKYRKVSFYTLVVTTLSFFVVQSDQLILNPSLDGFDQSSFSRPVTNNFSTSSDVSSFDFVNQNLNKQFADFVSRNYASLIDNIKWAFSLPLYEIFQWHSMDYLAWHTQAEHTWCVPINIDCEINRIPIYKNDHQDEQEHVNNLYVTELNAHADNAYLYGNFSTDDPIGSYDWYHPRVFDFTQAVKDNLVCTKTANQSVGFAHLIMKTQRIPISDRLSRSPFINLGSLSGHQFGDSSFDHFYFPRSGEIHDWGDAAVDLSFDDLYTDYLTLGTSSAFNCTLDRLWSKSIKYYVSRKTLLIIDHDWENKALLDVPYLDISKLFQLGSIGYDHKTKRYWYTLAFNQALLKGAIGAYYDQGITDLLDDDFSSDKSPINLSKCKYWNEKNRGLAQYAAGGKHSWVDPNLLTFEEQKNYPVLIEQLCDFLNQCAQNKTLTYDNYLAVKYQVNNYVRKNSHFPTNEWLAHKLTSDAEWRDNGWAADASEYNLTSDSLCALALILPEIRFSQFSMFDTTGTGSENWSNLDQDWNVGTVYDNQNWTSSFNDMIAGRNKIYLDPSQLKANAPINIMFNVGLLANAQTSEHFDYEDNYASVNDPISMETYKSCNEENIQSISAITNGNIQIKHDSFIVKKSGRSIVDFGYYQIRRDGEKIIPTNQLKDTGVVFKSSLRSQFPSEIWANAKMQNQNDLIKAIKSLFQDADGAPALPFCRADLWTNKLIDYDIPANKFQVQTDDILGTITFNLVDLPESVQISGLKQKSDTKPDPTPTPGPLPTPLPSPGDATKSKPHHDLSSRGTSLIIATSLLMVGGVATMLWVWLVLAKSKKVNQKVPMSYYRTYAQSYPKKFERRRPQSRKALPSHPNHLKPNTRHRWASCNQRKSNC